MKILLLTDGIYPFVMGGMQKHSYYLIKYFSLMNCSVEVVHFSNDETLDEFKVDSFKGFNKSLVSFNKFTFPKLMPIPGHYISENKKYSKLIFKEYKDKLNDFDLIYSQGFVAYEFINQKKNFTIPIFSNLHGFEMFQKPPNFKVKLEYLFLKGIAKKIIHGSDYLFSFGGKFQEIFNKLKVPTSKILECRIGIEKNWLTDMPATNEVRKFVFIGRNERRKGILELNSALKNLIDQHSFEMHFIGPIPEEARIKHSKITYYGSIVDEVEIQKILKFCDALICPSYSEGMPTVIMEAMASSLAIIATDVGAVNKQVDNENGWLLPNPNVNLLTNAMLEVINSSNLALMTKKNNSLHRIKTKFLWSNVIKNKIDLMERIIKI